MFSQLLYSINDVRRNVHAIPPALSWHLAASCFPAALSVPDRSRAARSKAPKGQNDSKENVKNEVRTKRVVVGAHAG